eukprot:903375-Amphidinium_carterae.1
MMIDCEGTFTKGIATCSTTKLARKQERMELFGFSKAPPSKIVNKMMRQKPKNSFAVDLKASFAFLGLLLKALRKVPVCCSSNVAIEDDAVIEVSCAWTVLKGRRQLQK